MALTAETDGPISGLSFDPQFWAGAIYARRSEAILLNAPWVDLPIIMLGLARSHPCANNNPGPMGACFAEYIGQPVKPELDFVIDEAADPANPLSERIARAYGLRASVNVNPAVIFYGIKAAQDRDP